MEILNKPVFSVFLLLLVVFIQCNAGGAEKEPRRESKCDIELKIVEKIVTMETELLHFREIIEKQQRKMERQQTDMESLRDELTGLQSKPTIAFLAELTTSMSGSDYRVYFQNVKLNLGNAYQPRHGLFIAPLNGTYLFAITACARRGNYITLELVVKNSGVGRLLAGDDELVACNSKQFIAQLEADDDVFVQHGGSGNSLYAISEYGSPTFMGVLVHAN